MFRTPAPALLVVFLLLIGMLPFAFAAPGLQALLAVPVGLAVWIVRNRTTATRHGLTVRTTLGTRELPWEAVAGLSLTRKAKVHAVLADGGTVPLPGVRTRHLPVISFVSEGRLPDPSGVLDGTRDTARAEGARANGTDDTQSAESTESPNDANDADGAKGPDDTEGPSGPDGTKGASGAAGARPGDGGTRDDDVDHGGHTSGA